MAAELARYGISVRIVDKAAQRTDKSKALVVWSRTLELMDRMGCTDDFLAAGFKVSAMNIMAGPKQIAHVTLGGVATPHPYALMLPQSDTERLLEKHLNACGVQIEREVELTGLKSSTDEIVSTLRHPDGSEENVETSWLIGCDGAHSTVRHQLGMKFVGSTLISDWILADVHLSGVPMPEEVSVAWHSDGVLVIFPISRDRYRVIADVGEARAEKLRPDPSLDEVQAILDRRGPGNIHASDPIWLAAFRINERKVSSYRAGRVFVAGDAAHIHSPAGGQGMNTGIQDACNLAWKLALVSRGICVAEPLLDSYSIERSAVGEQVLKGAGRVTSIGIMKGEIKQSIRNHIASLVFGLPPIRAAMVNALTEISIGYPDSPLTARGTEMRGGPIAGQRAPIRDGEPAVGAGDTPRFVLFAASGDNSSKLISQYPLLLDPGVREPFAAGGIWLIRPDGYTALVANHGEWTRVAAFLDQLTATPQRMRTEIQQHS
jgi:2-polyprenyl-6-methoxyphenol hydroxylase-like FAD-dependent oxidoreductase